MNEERSTDRLARYIIWTAAAAVTAAFCWYFRSVLVYIIIAAVVSLLGSADNERSETYQDKGQERAGLAGRDSLTPPDSGDILGNSDSDHPCILQHHNQCLRQPPVRLFQGFGDHRLVRQGERLADRQAAIHGTRLQTPRRCAWLDQERLRPFFRDLSRRLRGLSLRLLLASVCSR